MANEFDGDNRQDDDNRQCVHIGLAHVCVTAPRILLSEFAVSQRIRPVGGGGRKVHERGPPVNGIIVGCFNNAFNSWFENEGLRGKNDEILGI